MGHVRGSSIEVEGTRDAALLPQKNRGAAAPTAAPCGRMALRLDQDDAKLEGYRIFTPDTTRPLHVNGTPETLHPSHPRARLAARYATARFRACRNATGL